MGVAIHIYNSRPPPSPDTEPCPLIIEGVL